MQARSGASKSQLARPFIWSAAVLKGKSVPKRICLGETRFAKGFMTHWVRRLRGVVIERLQCLQNARRHLVLRRHAGWAWCHSLARNVSAAITGTVIKSH